MVKAVSGAMSIRIAAELYHVQKSTIADSVCGRFDLNAEPGRAWKKPALPKLVDDTIAETVKLAAKSDIGVYKKNTKTNRHPMQKG